MGARARARDEEKGGLGQAKAKSVVCVRLGLAPGRFTLQQHNTPANFLAAQL
jgi:hypothetical protein